MVVDRLTRVLERVGAAPVFLEGIGFSRTD